MENSPKLSLITVCFNSEDTIEDTLNSVQKQDYPNIELIVVDGNSADGTSKIVSSYMNTISTYVSEADDGIYDAMNKGIALAKGEVIGFLNSDDFLCDSGAVAKMMRPFMNPSISVVYGDLCYVKQFDTTKIVRFWRSGLFRAYKLHFGWTPAHPAFYARRALFQSYGRFDTKLRVAADYDLMLRFLKNIGPSQIAYVQDCIVLMRAGGESNRSFRNLFKAARECMEAARKNGLVSPLFSVLMKTLLVLPQFFMARHFVMPMLNPVKHN